MLTKSVPFAAMLPDSFYHDQVSTQVLILIYVQTHEPERISLNFFKRLLNIIRFPKTPRRSGVGVWERQGHVLSDFMW